MSKDIIELNSTIIEMDIIDIYGLLHPIIANYRFFSSSHGSFTKSDHILGHKPYVNKFKRIETMQCLLSDPSEIKLEIWNRKISGKFLRTWRLKTHF